MILHKGNTIRSGINNNNFVGMLEGPLLLLQSRDLIISINSSLVAKVIRKLKLFLDFKRVRRFVIYMNVFINVLTYINKEVIMTVSYAHWIINNLPID